MKFTLTQKILIATLLVTGSTIILLSWTLFERNWFLLDREVGQQLEKTALLASQLFETELLDLISEGEGEENSVVREVRRQLQQLKKVANLKDIFLLDKDFTMVVTLNKLETRGETNPFTTLDVAELSHVLKGRAMSTTLYLGEDHNYYKRGYAALQFNNKVEYILGLEMKAEGFLSLYQLRNTFITVGTIALLMVFFLTLMMVRAITKPIQLLTKAATQVSQGDYDCQLPVKGRDELADLTRFFNQMIESVHERQQNLEGSLNLTEERFAEVSTLLDLLFASMPSGIALFDNQLCLTFSNQRFSTILSEDFVHKNGSAYQEIFANFTEIQTLITSIDPDDREVKKLAFSPQENLHLNLLAIPLINSNDQFTGLALLVDDVSREVKYEKLTRRKAHLESLGEMSARIAHELRNPLGAIQGYSELASRRDKEDEKLQKYHSNILTEVQDMNGIITNFLQFARPEQRVNKTIIIKELLHKIVFSLQPLLKNKKIEIGMKFADDIRVVGDEKSLQQIFQNLLRNSIEAMEETGEIIIEMSNKQDDVVVFTISDTGSGLPEEIRDFIFDPFFTRKTHGTGLGLAIVQRNMEELGGSIRVESMEERGTTFTLELPTKKRDEL